ncbi:MAG: GNAT family N-acetyltransferase, partial [Eubacteriales bacterium]|nr:GNAT family N-acetyltransferase [Eubacteriales bacterium]
SIYLLPAYIGKGYGSQLLRQVIVELNNQGYNKILLWVLNENRRAKEFYKMNGFVETHHITNINIGGKELQEIMFVYKESK